MFHMLSPHMAGTSCSLPGVPRLSGTYGDGSGAGCTPCDAGRATASVGQSSCSSLCARGTYAEAGASDCQPCPAGTYTGVTGSGVCKAW